MLIGEGTTYGLVDERRRGLVVVHSRRWVVGREEGMLTVCVIITVRVQLENCGEIKKSAGTGERKLNQIRTHSLQPLCDAIQSVLVSVSVLVV